MYGLITKIGISIVSAGFVLSTVSSAIASESAPVFQGEPSGSRGSGRLQSYTPPQSDPPGETWPAGSRFCKAEEGYDGTESGTENDRRPGYGATADFVSEVFAKCNPSPICSMSPDGCTCPGDSAEDAGGNADSAK